MRICCGDRLPRGRRQRLGEAADAVAAHLGAAAVGVVQHHLRGVAVGRLADEQSVGADAAAAVAQLGGPARPGRSTTDGDGANATRKSLPSPWCLVSSSFIASAVPHDRHGLGDRVVLDVDPVYAGVAAEPPLLAHRELPGPHDDLLDRVVE